MGFGQFHISLRPLPVARSAGAYLLLTGGLPAKSLPLIAKAPPDIWGGLSFLKPDATFLYLTGEQTFTFAARPELGFIGVRRVILYGRARAVGKTPQLPVKLDTASWLGPPFSDQPAWRPFIADTGQTADGQSESVSLTLTFRGRPRISLMAVILS